MEEFICSRLLVSLSLTESRFSYSNHNNPLLLGGVLKDKVKIISFVPRLLQQ